MFGSVETLGKLESLGKPNLGKVMRKNKASRIDMDYIMEKERKESKKRSKAWREMRKSVATMKRLHDRTKHEDGSVLEGWDGKDFNDGYGFGDEHV